MAQIEGNDRNNNLVGTTAGDVILGYGGHDTLLGRSGADSLYGGPGNDLLDGGAGNDLLNGGGGVDTVRYDNFEGIEAYLGTGTVSFPGTTWRLERLYSIENIIAGWGDDTVYGDDGANEIWGRDGDDYLVGYGGSDIFVGGAGADTIYGGSAEWDDDPHPLATERDTVRYDGETVRVRADLYNREITVAGDATDYVHGIENVWTGAGQDVLLGDSGDNELRGGAGADVLYGRPGDDTLRGQGGTDYFDGGAGFDTVDYSENTTSVRVDLVKGVVSFPGQRWPNETIVSIESAITGSGNDTLIGNSQANVFEGGAGADRIVGRGGSDTVSFAGETRGVQINLETGRSGVIGDTARDRLVSIENALGGSSNDRIIGDNRANVLDGGDGSDTIDGGRGGDTLMLSSGNDRLDGGAGFDTLVFDQPYEKYDNGYVEYESPDAEGIENWFFYGPTEVTLSIDLEGTSTFYYGAVGSSTLRNIENVTTGVGNDHVYGSSADNVISVGSGANYVDARGGDDTIYGSSAEDWNWPRGGDDRDKFEIIRGGAGNDLIVGASQAFGDAGADTLVAGRLSEVTMTEETMTGGAGADMFQFSDGYLLADLTPVYSWQVQSGLITDFSPEEGDRIVVDRVDDSAPVPVFAGYVEDQMELEEGEYGIVGERTFVLAVHHGTNEWTEEEYRIDLTIELQGFTGTFTEADVLFI